MKLTQCVHFTKCFKRIDFDKNQTNHFKLKICISCLRDKIRICCQIFGKLAQFIYIINGLNPIDFEINLPISKEKVAFCRLIFLITFFSTTVANSIGNCDLKCIHFSHYWIYKNWWWRLWKLHIYLLNKYNLLKISLLWLTHSLKFLSY